MCGNKWVWGIFFIILGSAWIGTNLGYVPANIWAWWPLIFVLIGLSTLASSLLWGLFFLLLGAAWIGTNLGVIPATIWNWWPLFFVVIGLSIIFGKPKPHYMKPPFGKFKDMDWEDADWDKFGTCMEEFGKSMEKAFKKKKRKSKKKSRKKRRR